MSKASYERLRSMYPGGTADKRARRYARFWITVIGFGLLPRRWVTLEVVGRSTGRLVRFPLGMADVSGQWYLVSMLGEHCNWVRNVRASAGRATLRRRTGHVCQLVELEPAERPQVLARYLRKVPGGRPHIAGGEGASTAELAAVADHYPVFRVEFLSTPIPPPAIRLGAARAR